MYLNDVYNHLRSKTEEYNTKRVLLAKVRDKINEGVYAGSLLAELQETEKALSITLNKFVDQTIKEAQGIFDAEVERLEEENSLRAADLSDDAKILESGILLKKKDIDMMLARPENQNETMRRLINDYVDRNKIKDPATGLKMNVPGRQNQGEIDSVKHNAAVLTYYKRWMPGEENLKMLDKFLPDQAAEAQEEQ